MPQPAKKTQNAVPPKVPRPKASDLKAPIVRRPPTPPKLRREEAFVHEEASDTESDPESDFEEEMRYDVELNKHHGGNADGKLNVQHNPGGTQRRQPLCYPMDPNSPSSTPQWKPGRPDRRSHKDILNLLHARFEGDHHGLNEQRSSMDVEKNLL